MSLLERAITALKEAATRPVMEEQELEEVFQHIECGTPINEQWSDAARAASAAARKARASGKDWRAAGLTAFTRSKAGRKTLIKSYRKSGASDKFQKRMEYATTGKGAEKFKNEYNRGRRAEFKKAWAKAKAWRPGMK